MDSGTPLVQLITLPGLCFVSLYGHVVVKEYVDDFLFHISYFYTNISFRGINKDAIHAKGPVTIL